MSTPRSRLGVLVAALAAGLAAPSAPAATLPVAPQDTGCDGIPLILTNDPAPIGTGPCGGVRPGARVSTDRGGCSLNFVFTGSDGHTYVGTAGHCIVGSGTTRTWTSGGPVARTAAGRIGEFAYATLAGAEDFALIRLDAGVESNPAMCHFGGPTGIYNEAETGAIPVHHYGQGVGWSSIVPARTGLAIRTPSPHYVFFYGAASWGDSGSGTITSDGRAVGVLVALSLHAYGVVRTTRIAPQIETAEGALGITLELQTAPLAGGQA